MGRNIYRDCTVKCGEAVATTASGVQAVREGGMYA